MKKKVTKKKSLSEKAAAGELRIATPQNIVWLLNSGLIVPDDLDPSDETIPLDFTRLSNGEVGALHSRFAVRHAHALYVKATFATEMLALKRHNRIALATFRVKQGRKHRTEKSLTDAFLLSKLGSKMDDKMTELQIRNEITDAVVNGFEDIVKAASREMSRRDSERAPRD